MANPVMNSKNFQQQMHSGQSQPSWYAGAPQGAAQTPYGQTPYGQAPQGQRPYGQAPYGQQAGAPDLEQMYAAPAAGPADTGRMTYNDIVGKTAFCLVLVVVGGAVGWMFPGIGIVGAIIGFVLGLVNAFKKNPSPALILAYSAAQGLFLGAFSSIMEGTYPGIVVQAVLGTLSVFAVTLALFSSGKFRPTPKMTKIFMIAMLGYLVFSLVNVGMMLFGVTDSMFGMRSGMIGVVIGLLAVLLASYSLVMDFQMAEDGVRNGVPEKFSWTVAFGLTVTLIWLYVEILRILAILRGDD
ncbi:putative YccA/Bax inhibitor family protein [Micrococcus cohnii]|uniref:Putative YccA/Bax inhibitor family protein n=2 Tax=Micrococcus cohnii TaxID=993416 RepID=A0A7W7DY78_9MICC|nr:putative YccA/Bax inhibitor family protein [Micrococcus cohnii]